MSETGAVPLTLEGSSVLHQMFRFDWPRWLALPEAERQSISAESCERLAGWEAGAAEGHPNQSALFSQIGHKSDLMLVHFRDSMEELNRIELALAQTALFPFLTQSDSYLSVVELGLYESSTKAYESLTADGLAEHSPEWNAALAEILERQARAMESRLFPSIPGGKYICFYPMDRKRGEAINWYTEPMSDRRRMMHEHGLIGRRYADSVRQIISGSIGFDDWEWGVDLFADDPLVFKKLIYEMRFDEVSAKYALFGAFTLGVRVRAGQLGAWLSGQLG